MSGLFDPLFRRIDDHDTTNTLIREGISRHCFGVTKHEDTLLIQEILEILEASKVVKESR